MPFPVNISTLNTMIRLTRLAGDSGALSLDRVFVRTTLERRSLECLIATRHSAVKETIEGEGSLCELLEKRMLTLDVGNAALLSKLLKTLPKYVNEIQATLGASGLTLEIGSQAFTVPFAVTDAPPIEGVFPAYLEDDALSVGLNPDLLRAIFLAMKQAKNIQGVKLHMSKSDPKGAIGISVGVQQSGVLMPMRI